MTKFKTLDGLFRVLILFIILPPIRFCFKSEILMDRRERHESFTNSKLKSNDLKNQFLDVSMDLIMELVIKLSGAQKLKKTYLIEVEKLSSFHIRLPLVTSKQIQSPTCQSLME